MRRVRGSLAAVAAAAALAGGAAASMALGDGAGPGARATALDPDELAGIPAPDRALALASDRWQRLTRRPVASLASLGGAHPGAKSIRVSRSRARLTGRGGAQRFPYPRRTVIVKTGSVVGVLTLVAFMRKVRAGSAISSWRYVEYTRSGAGDRFSRVGGGQGLCSSCHMQAARVQRSDSVFFRLG